MTAMYMRSHTCTGIEAGEAKERCLIRVCTCSTHLQHVLDKKPIETGLWLDFIVK